MSSASAGGPAPRRAPRLGSGDSIAGYFTRAGRFARIDPRQGRPPPPATRWVALLGWALLLEESLRRARAAARSPADAAEGGSTAAGG